MKNKIIISLILTAAFLKLGLYIFANKEYFLRPFNFDFFSKLYSESQYVVGERSKGGIGDDGLYAFAGYYYLFQKGDVSAVNFEHPPLGKYLIGLSIFLFHNENAINLIYFGLLMLYTYKIGIKIFKNSILAVTGVFVLSLNNLILDNLLRSLLDLPFTLFFVMAVYYFLLAFENKRNYYWSSFFWALAFSTRFFPSIILIIPLLFIIVLGFDKKNVKRFIISLLLIPFVYLLCHISFFIYHPSFIEFLRHKRWMLDWFAGSVRITGNIFRNIFTGYYVDSTGKMVSNEHWSILLPIVTTLGILSWRKSFLRKKDVDLLVIYLITFIFLIYVSIATGGLEKFIMPIFPLLVVLSVGNLAFLYSIIKRWRVRKLSVLKEK